MSRVPLADSHQQRVAVNSRDTGMFHHKARPLSMQCPVFTRCPLKTPQQSEREFFTSERNRAHVPTVALLHPPSPPPSPCPHLTAICRTKPVEQQYGSDADRVIACTTEHWSTRLHRMTPQHTWPGVRLCVTRFMRCHVEPPPLVTRLSPAHRLRGSSMPPAGLLVLFMF